mmetsp:Transcript_42958/g.114907  ORF Transcript_42958/g.114907 Transcript_42958/m.114907 type:complete len:187 (+) Transcript_42958:156-716(+)
MKIDGIHEAMHKCILFVLALANAAKQRPWLGPNNMVSGSPPSPRGYTPLARYGEEIYLFGGYNAADSNDIFKFDAENLSWTDLTTYVRGDAPRIRDSHGLGQFNETLFVFGGWSGIVGLNDLHTLDLASLTWFDVTASIRGAPPLPRYGMGFTLCRNIFFGFGGFNSQGKYVACFHRNRQKKRTHP